MQTAAVHFDWAKNMELHICIRVFHRFSIFGRIHFDQIETCSSVDIDEEKSMWSSSKINSSIVLTVRQFIEKRFIHEHTIHSNATFFALCFALTALNRFSISFNRYEPFHEILSPHWKSNHRVYLVSDALNVLLTTDRLTVSFDKCRNPSKCIQSALEAHCYY